MIDALLCEEPGLWEGEVQAGVKVKTLVEDHRALTETAGHCSGSQRPMLAGVWVCWRRDWGALGVLARAAGWTVRNRLGGRENPRAFPDC